MPTLQPIRSLCGPLRYSSYARQVYYLGNRGGLVPGTERTAGVLQPVLQPGYYRLVRSGQAALLEVSKTA